MISSLFRRSSLAGSHARLSVASNRGFRSDLYGTNNWNWTKKDDLAYLRAMEYFEPRPPTVKIAVTGSSGNIGYALLFRIASGEMFGKNQRVQIHIFDIPPMIEKVKGVAMELYDCAFPTCEGILVTDDIERAFADIDVALLVGSKPRGPGMERGDLLRDNGKIFQSQGQALNKCARKSVKVVVVGNPVNTNCLILANNAPDIPLSSFCAMTRLDHDRGLAQIAKKAQCGITDVEKFCIWGNHSPTMFPDLSNATIYGRPALEVLRDVNKDEDIDKWYRSEFIPAVQQRGAAIIQARGASSAASAANACLMCARDWEKGTNGGWTSMAVACNKEYGITPGLFFSYPVVCGNEGVKIVDDLPAFDSFAQEKINATEKELLSEKDAVASMLPN